MSEPPDRRDFLRQALGGAAVTAALHLDGGVPAFAAVGPSAVSDHTLTVISGKPRERGRQYGRTFKAAIHRFLDREIVKRFTTPAIRRDDLLRYAGQCVRAIKDYSRPILDELEGMAEGSGLRLEEVVLITLHEEVGKKGA